ncbi:hypothetical protein LEP1GSC166_1850 [Leptospira kirschneri]|uniref:hypothetical protein n=1 Tax=Leptospira kirschneri TaxID=29507 RepID=UPI0002BE8EC0|nr:hypothetical protein [Leptospira kirschneri]EMK02832.1 hypothetical protein LEP1GSC166_1850 [Leptospira kirschneri]
MSLKDKKKEMMLRATAGTTEVVASNVTRISNVDQDAEDINSLHFGAMNDMQNAVRKFILAGEKLISKKQSLRHGEFRSWVEREIKFGHAQVSRYMLLAENKEIILAKGAESLRSALKLISAKDEPTKERTTEKQIEELYKKFRNNEKISVPQKRILCEFLENKKIEVEKRKQRIEIKFQKEIQSLQTHIDQLR